MAARRRLLPNPRAPPFSELRRNMVNAMLRYDFMVIIKEQQVVPRGRLSQSLDRDWTVCNIVQEMMMWGGECE